MTTELTSAARRTASVAGVHEETTPDKTLVRYPAAGVGRVFVPHPQPPPRDLMPTMEKLTEPWRAAGLAYLSYKPRPADVAKGLWDGFHHELGAWLAGHPTVRIIVYHEPEGGRDRVEGEAFAHMFNRARKEIKKGWKGARVAYCAMAYQWRPKGDAAAAPEHWQQVEADEYLCDVYSGKEFPETTILPEHPGFLGWFDKIVRPRLARGEAIDWGLGERGFKAKKDSVRAATIRRESAWLTGRFDHYDDTRALADLPPSLYVAWSSPGWEKDPGWVLTKDSAVAMRELIAAFARRGTLDDH